MTPDCLVEDSISGRAETIYVDSRFGGAGLSVSDSLWGL